MDEISLLNSLLTMWIAITAVFAGMLMLRSWICMRTDNIVILDASESGIPAELAALTARVDRIAACSRVLGCLSLILLTGVMGVFVHHTAAILSRI